LGLWVAGDEPIGAPLQSGQKRRNTTAAVTTVGQDERTEKKHEENEANAASKFISIIGARLSNFIKYRPNINTALFSRFYRANVLNCLFIFCTYGLRRYTGSQWPRSTEDSRRRHLVLIKNAHYFILVFGWVRGGMGGISPFSGFVSPFSCFVSIDFSVLMLEY